MTREELDQQIFNAVYRYIHEAPVFTAEYRSRRNEAVTILTHRACCFTGAANCYVQFASDRDVEVELAAIALELSR